MGKTFIYGLKDPVSDEIRYVGKSNNPKSRLSRHIYDAKETKSVHRLCWIKGLLDRGEKPILIILEECDVSVWGDRENYWISNFSNLTNMIDGGKFCPMLNSSIVEKMKATKKSNPQIFTEETRIKLSISTKSLWERGIIKPRGEQTIEERNNRKIIMKDIWQNRSILERKRVGKLISQGRNKPVIKLDMIGNYLDEYISAKEAELKNGICKDKVSACCRNERKTAGGYKWILKSKYKASDEIVVNQQMN